MEYKSKGRKPRELAKSLSSFANRSGGWLFLGIQEDPADNTAASFPGVPAAEVPSIVEQLRNAAKDLLQPTVPFMHHALQGPLAAISLPAGRSIIVVRIPEGASTPYVHNDGRVYVRTGDSSSPIPANDRATLDLLHRKREEKTSLLRSLVDRRPEVSKAEGEVGYLHLIVCSDPFQVLGHRYGGSYSDFCAVMAASPLPFDNMYSSQDGFIARQARNNVHYNRLLTWEFSRACNSFVTLPIPVLQAPLMYPDGSLGDLGDWTTYTQGERFARLLGECDLSSARVLNLNLLVTLFVTMIARHRTLAGRADVTGPFFIKAHLDNVWRTIPFIDTEEYMNHVEAFGLPIVQDSDVTAPPGGWPEGFVAAPELDRIPSEDEHGPHDVAIRIWAAVMQSLGIPGEVLNKSATQVLGAAAEEAKRHRDRLDGSTVISPS